MSFSARAICLSYAVWTVAYNALGVGMRVSCDARRWWGTCLIATYVYAFASAPLRYDVDYLLGTEQPYAPMEPVMICLVAYLMCDLLHRPPEPSIDQKIAQFRDHLREYGLGTHIGPTMHQIF